MTTVRAVYRSFEHFRTPQKKNAAWCVSVAWKWQVCSLWNEFSREIERTLLRMLLYSSVGVSMEDRSRKAS